MQPLEVTIYTDPGCPFGFNAQRQELQLQWHYGHGADIARRMIVLSDRSSSYEERGLSAELVAANAQRLRERYGMPMRTEAAQRLPSTLPACRAYVGARMHEPQRADRLLRALRRRAFSDGQALDDPSTLTGAARDAEIAPSSIERWRSDDEVQSQLRADMVATRSPAPEALALGHRLSKDDGAPRYSTASAVFKRGDRQVVMPGFQPFAVYEVAVANAAPDVERRPPPRTVDELLAWAPYPLATAEVAELRAIELEDARHELQRAGAQFTAAAGDGYWSAGR